MGNKTVSKLLICGSLLVMDATAAEPVVEFAPPAYKQLRYDEDYRYLQDAEKRTDFLDSVKYCSLDRAADWWATLGGEARLRYEYFKNPQWGAAPQDNNGYLLQRYMLHGDVHYQDVFRLFTKFKSGLVEDRTGGPRPTDQDDFDLHQLFVDGRIPWGEKQSLTLRAGRQELAYGSSRLISYRESPNVRLSFDGAKAMLQLDSWHVDAFAVRPVDTNPGVFDDGSDPDTKLWGVYAVTPIRVLPGWNGDFYYLGIERDDATFDQGTARELRHSFGTRLWGKRAKLDWNFEFVYQFGTFGDGDISAWTAASDTGYTFAELAGRPRLGLKADITSGDKDPSDRDLETFNPLFPKGAYFSETGLIGPANHIDLHPSLELNPTKQLTLTIDWGFFWRESAHDGIYNNGVDVTVPAGSSRARYVGDQVQMLAEWRIQRHLAWTAAYAHFFAGDFLSDNTPGKDVDYVSTWLTFKF
jgi:hypothetical protein